MRSSSLEEIPSLHKMARMDGLEGGGCPVIHGAGMAAPPSAPASRTTSDKMARMDGLEGSGCPVIHGAGMPAHPSAPASRTASELQAPLSSASATLSMPAPTLPRLPQNQLPPHQLYQYLQRRMSASRTSPQHGPIVASRTPSMSSLRGQLSNGDVLPEVQDKPGAKKINLATLPDEVLARIAVYLPQWSLLQFTATCQRFANIVVRAYRCRTKIGTCYLFIGVLLWRSVRKKDIRSSTAKVGY